MEADSNATRQAQGAGPADPLPSGAVKEQIPNQQIHVVSFHEWT